MSLLGTLATIGNIAGTVGTVANTIGQIGSAVGAWGQVGQSQSQGGSTQQGGGKSQSVSMSGTNDEQVMQYLKGAYQYQNIRSTMQSILESQSRVTINEQQKTLLS